MIGIGIGLGKGVVSFVGLLDSYPTASMAYSLRKLRGNYSGPAIQVRRSIDNNVLNIGFTALGNLDTTALTSFCGAGDGFVTTWYDQSGNGNNATQSTAANQPQIVSSGSVINRNGKTTIQYDAINDYFSFNYQWANNTFDVFAVNTSTQDKFKAILSESNVGALALGSNASAVGKLFSILKSAVTSYSFTSVQTDNVQFLVNYYSDNGIVSGGINAKFRKNNGSEESNNSASGLITNSNSLIGSSGGSGDFWGGDIQELILYSSSKSTDRTGISNNINTYYGIY